MISSRLALGICSKALAVVVLYAEEDSSLFHFEWRSLDEHTRELNAFVHFTPD